MKTKYLQMNLENKISIVMNSVRKLLTTICQSKVMKKMESEIFGNAQSSENPIIIVSENILIDKMN